MTPRAANRFLTRLWGTVVEPRSVTALTVIAYALTAMLGYSLLMAPPTGHENDVILRAFCAVFLIGGGSVGVPTAWTGSWWLEQAAAVSAGAGMIITLTEVMSVHASRGLATPWVTVIALILAALFWAARYYRVKEMPYAPGKGPLLPEQRRAVEEALADSLTDEP